MNTRTLLIGIGGFIILVVIILVLRNLVSSGSGFNFFGSGAKVTINAHTFNVQVMKTEAEREKGLSGKGSLAQDRGMLFDFSTPDVYPFWMKNMKFPLDIIFINDNKIVTVVKNASDDQTKLIYIYPSAPVNHVLEINAGLSDKYNLHEGDAVTISE